MGKTRPHSHLMARPTASDLNRKRRVGGGLLPYSLDQRALANSVAVMIECADCTGVTVCSGR